jgi:hypothetical protein
VDNLAAKGRYEEALEMFPNRAGIKPTWKRGIPNAEMFKDEPDNSFAPSINRMNMPAPERVQPEVQQRTSLISREEEADLDDEDDQIK